MQTLAKIVDKVLTIWLFFLHRKKKRAGDAFVDFAHINSIIKSLVHTSPLNIERVMILRAHNGNPNKKLMPIGWKYSSCIANDYKPPFIDKREMYQNVLQDNDYIARLADLYLRKELEVRTETMADGVLKNIYLTEGVRFSKFFFLAHNEDELWFMSVATSIEGEYFETPEHKSQLHVGINKIRDIVKPYFK